MRRERSTASITNRESVRLGSSVVSRIPCSNTPVVASLIQTDHRYDQGFSLHRLTSTSPSTCRTATAHVPSTRHARCNRFPRHGAFSLPYDTPRKRHFVASRISFNELIGKCLEPRSLILNVDAFRVGCSAEQYPHPQLRLKTLGLPVERQRILEVLIHAPDRLTGFVQLDLPSFRSDGLIYIRLRKGIELGVVQGTDTKYLSELVDRLERS